MAFCISYKESCAESPYEDWINSGKPETAAIRSCQGVRYVSGVQTPNIDYVLVPNMDLLRIEVSFLVCGFRATTKVTVDTDNRMVHITEAHCSAWNSDKSSQAPTGSGSIELLSKLIHFYNKNCNNKIGLCDSIAQNIFGNFWRMSRMPVKDKRLSYSHVERLNDWLYKHNFDRKHTARYAYYDMTRDISAIKIQAAFRGWRTRMQYRYNPYNNLGRFVILREAGFDPHAS